MLKLFITATDTDAGKTYVAQALIHAFVAENKKVAVYKPISAGCERINGALVNEDAKLLQMQSNCQQTIEQVNPIAFEPAIAPHIAAAKEQSVITLASIEHGFEDTIKLDADIIVCEGAGGWRLPLGKGKFLSEFAQMTNQQIILVVNMKLGCLNHAMLTYQSILSDGLVCVGWIANCQEDMSYLAENIAELTSLLPIPKLAELSFEPEIKKAAQKIDLSVLSALL
jgi:dethiobiotin synthetase